MKIIEVTDLISDIENLNDNIPKHKATVMVYTMKNCPHCVNLKPKWDMVKTQMNNDVAFNNVLSADIDSSATPLLTMPPVAGFPTIRILKEGKLHEYNGNREVDPILSYLKRMVKSPQTHRRTHRKRHRSTSNRRTHRKRHRSTSNRRTHPRTHRRTHRKRRRSASTPHPRTLRRSPQRPSQQKSLRNTI
tara:strand:+ start:4100 stop:4669 length:570 start_codon:yes stop_codon:yes gene_type:complete